MMAFARILQGHSQQV